MFNKDRSASEHERHVIGNQVINQTKEDSSEAGKFKPRKVFMWSQATVQFSDATKE